MHKLSFFADERLLPRLRDAAFTKILLVTLPEATPVHEAAALAEVGGLAARVALVPWGAP